MKSGRIILPGIAELKRYQRNVLKYQRRIPVVVSPLQETLAPLLDLRNIAGKLQEVLAKYERLESSPAEFKRTLNLIRASEEFKRIAQRRNKRWVYKPPVMGSGHLPNRYQIELLRLIDLHELALTYEKSYPVARPGAPAKTRGLTLDEQELAEKMRHRGKGTERGSLNFIREEFSERNLPSAKKKAAATIQNLKRHFRRKRRKSRPI